MDECLESYLAWLREHGVSFDVAPDLQRHPDHDGPLAPGDEDTRLWRFRGVPPILEHREQALGFAADHATASVAEAVLRDGGIVSGSRVWDIGCGTGVLAVIAAHLGARVIGTDLEEHALRRAARTVTEAGVRVRLLRGSLLEPMPEGEIADVVLANLPHKPVPERFELTTAQNGGPDGAAVHTAFLDQLRRRLEPGARIFFFLHSLPSPRLLRRYGERCNVALLAWKLRFLQPGEYGDLQAYFEERARAGESFLAEEDGRRCLVAGVWRAELR